MKKPLMLLANPMAGRGLMREGFGELLETFYAGGYAPTVFFTEGAGSANRLAAEYAQSFERIVCLGGDGTLSDVMGGLMALPRDARPPIGYIPMGTANDVATTLALPRNAIRAAQLVLRGRPIAYDVGHALGAGYFSYIAAFGAFTEVSYTTPQEAKMALGHLAYLLEGMSRLPRLRHYAARVEYDGGVIEEDLCFGGVSNSTSVAGLVRLDGGMVELGDGMFEIILIKNPKRVQDLGGIVSGLVSRSFSTEQVALLQSSRVRFSFREPVAWTRDGEAGGLFSDLTLINERGAVQIIVDG